MAIFPGAYFHYRSYKMLCLPKYGEISIALTQILNIIFLWPRK